MQINGRTAAVHGILFIEGAKEPLEAIMSVHNRMVSKGAIFHAFQKATVSEPVVKQSVWAAACTEKMQLFTMSGFPFAEVGRKT